MIRGLRAFHFIKGKVKSTRSQNGRWDVHPNRLALDGRARRCRRRKNPFILLALVKTTQRLLSCCSLTWAHPFRPACRLDCLRFAVTFELAQFVILHDPEHEWAFLNNFNSSPVFSIADSLLHHPFKNLGPSPHLIYPTSASVAERRGLRKLMISRSLCGKAGLELWRRGEAKQVIFWCVLKSGIQAARLPRYLRYPRSCSTQLLPSGSEKLAKLA
jgi:hypothetical protein